MSVDRLYITHFFPQISGSNTWSKIRQYITIDNNMKYHLNGTTESSLKKSVIEELAASGKIVPVTNAVLVVKDRCLHITPLNEVFYAYDRVPEMDRGAIKVYSFNKF